MNGPTTALESALVDLGHHLATPDGGEVVERVTLVLRADGRRHPTGREPAAGARRHPRRRWWRPWTVGVALLAATVGGSMAPSVARRLGIGNVTVHQAPLPVPPGSLGGGDLDLGRQVTQAEAATIAGFQPVVPAVLGRPDQVWVDTRGPAPIVTLQYRDGPLIGELTGRMITGGVIQKFTGPGAHVSELTVAGRPALWIEGTHEVGVESGATFVTERLRLSDSVLLVDHGALTIRIETTAGRDEAIRIAASLPS